MTTETSPKAVAFFQNTTALLKLICKIALRYLLLAQMIKKFSVL